MAIDVSPEQLAIVKSILHEQLPAGSQVWAFGSRAVFATKPQSDLDLAIDANHAPLGLSVMSQLAEAFDESSLPFKVDLVDFNTASKQFKAIIDAQKVVLIASPL